MPQLHLYVPEEVASLVRERARARGMTPICVFMDAEGRRNLAH